MMAFKNTHSRLKRYLSVNYLILNRCLGKHLDERNGFSNLSHLLAVASIVVILAFSFALIILLFTLLVNLLKDNPMVQWVTL